MLYIGNALSLNMLPEGAKQGCFRVYQMDLESAQNTAREFKGETVSAVGHADTANIFAALLGVPVAANRVSVVLKQADQLLIGQYNGPRLPEGAKELPAGAKIDWYLVSWIDARWDRRPFWYGEHRDEDCPYKAIVQS